MKAFGMIAICGLALAGLAALKHALDALDEPLGDLAETDRAVEFDGYVTLHPSINR